MYEEEDDDLPVQYRRLTAHLQTGSGEFNRRLAAYLTNHVAMRSALDQAITNSYAQQYPNAPQFMHNQQSMYPSPLIPPNMMLQQTSPIQQSPIQQSPRSYRQSPYPTPTTPVSRPEPHARSASIATPHELPSYSQKDQNNNSNSAHPPEIRRMSMPPPSVTSRSSPTAQSSRATPMPKQSSASPTSNSGVHAIKMAQSSPQLQQQSVPQYNPAMYQNTSPFSMALPPESQMLLGSALDPNDPLTSMLMAGSENMQEPFYNFNVGLAPKQSNLHPSYDGMSATLAPSALDMSPSQTRYMNPSLTSAESFNTSAYNFGFDGNAVDLKGVNFTRSNSGAQSGTTTPGIDGTWDTFINDNSWTENAT